MFTIRDYFHLVIILDIRMLRRRKRKGLIVGGSGRGTTAPGTSPLLCGRFREAAKKKSSTNGQAIKALPPPPSSLMAIGTFFFLFSFLFLK